MALYRISGVWESNGVITHYAFHESSVNGAAHGAQMKKSKAEAIRILETAGNSATTITWNYTQAAWYIGEPVTVVGSGANKYLKSKPDSQLTDNLNHLIRWDTVS